MNLKIFSPGGLFGRKAAELTYDQIAGLIDNGGLKLSDFAGMPVTEKTLLQTSTVLACVKVIADGCATPELRVFREKDDGTRQKATNIPEYRLLNRRPNEFQTSFEWRRMMTVHAALTGTGLSLKIKGANNRVSELLPIPPGFWYIRRINRYNFEYVCSDEFGEIGVFKPDQVFTLQNLQWEWHKSLDAVTLAARAAGLAMATENSQASMHKNGLRS